MHTKSNIAVLATFLLHRLSGVFQQTYHINMYNNRIPTPVSPGGATAAAGEDYWQDLRRSSKKSQCLAYCYKIHNITATTSQGGGDDKPHTPPPRNPPSSWDLHLSISDLPTIISFMDGCDVCGS